MTSLDSAVLKKYYRKKEGEELGLAFVGRGFGVRVAVPFNGSFDDGLKKAARACIEACPTAALAWRDEV